MLKWPKGKRKSDGGGASTGIKMLKASGFKPFQKNITIEKKMSALYKDCPWIIIVCMKKELLSKSFGKYSS